MNILQASERFGVDVNKLRSYEEQGLLDCHKKEDGTIDYCDELMDYVAIITVLREAGAKPEQLRSYMESLMTSSITKEEKLRFLSRQRAQVLEDIHAKQKSLDKLDYMIHEARKAGQ